MGSKLPTADVLREGVKSLLEPIRLMLSAPRIEGIARAHDVERAARAAGTLLVQPQPSLLAFDRLAMLINAADDATNRRHECRSHVDADSALQAEWLVAVDFLAGK